MTPRLRLLAVVLAIGAAALMLRHTHAVGFIGWDSYPEIASSRIESFQDFTDTFREKTAAGYYPFDFYRPTFNLSLALDYAIWGLDRFGYQLTGVILYALCGLALFGLACSLLGPQAVWGPLASLVLYLIAPSHVEIVSLISCRMDMIAALFATLSLWAQRSRIDRPMPQGAWLPAGLTLLAGGAKETAFLVVPVVFVLALVYAEERPERNRWRHAAATVAPHFVAIALLLAARFLALGGLGGHTTVDPMGFVTHALPNLGRELLSLGRISGIRQFYFSYVGGTALALGLFVGLRAVLRSGDPSESSAAPRNMALVGLAWLAVAGSIYGASGHMRQWYLFIPSIGFALLIGAAVEWLRIQLSTRSGVLRGAAVAALVLILLSAVRMGSASPLIKGNRHLLRGTLRADGYLRFLEKRIARAKPGATLRVRPPPGFVAYPGGKRSVLASYSVQAWADLTLDTPVRARYLREPSTPEDSRSVVVLFDRSKAAKPEARGR